MGSSAQRRLRSNSPYLEPISTRIERLNLDSSAPKTELFTRERFHSAIELKFVAGLWRRERNPFDKKGSRAAMSLEARYINPYSIMKTRSTVPHSIKVVSLALALSTLTYTQSGAAPSSPVTSPASAANAPSSSISRSDRRFIEKAAQSGMTEVEVARLANARATDSSLKTFAQQLVTDHEAANAELATLAARKGVTLPSPDRETQRYDALTKKKVGTEFDEAFAKQMAGDHDDAVSLYEKAAKKSDDPEIATFASKYLPKLEEHRRTAETLQKALKG